MKKDTLVNAMIIILVGLVLLTIVVAVLTGENGLINKEKEKYNETHIEEIQEKQENNVVVIQNN